MLLFFVAEALAPAYITRGLCPLRPLRRKAPVQTTVCLFFVPIKVLDQ